jgi:N utilization substance protein B
MAHAPKSRPRTGSRFAAVQALFQTEQGGEHTETVIDQFVQHRLGDLEGTATFEDGQVADVDVTLFIRVVREAVRRQDTIDPMIANALPSDWPLGRLDPVLRALLRAGGAELAMTDGPPAKVVINEYLDIARGFFDGPEPSLANAVLDKLARSLRAKEF